MDFCPVCNLDLSLVTNKDFHVNSCFDNNNNAQEAVNLVEKKNPQKTKAVPQNHVTQNPDTQNPVIQQTPKQNIVIPQNPVVQQTPKPTPKPTPKQSPVIQQNNATQPIPKQSPVIQQNSVTQPIPKQSPVIQQNSVTQPIPKQSPVIQQNNVTQPIPKQSPVIQQNSVTQPIPKQSPVITQNSIVQPTPKLMPKLVEEVPKKNRPNISLPNSKKQGDMKEVYVVCPYINCDFSSLTEFFPSHVLTDHIEETKQNYACPICSHKGVKYNPGPGTNLLLHISEEHADYLDIYNDADEVKSTNKKYSNNKIDFHKRRRSASTSTSNETVDTETESDDDGDISKLFNDDDERPQFPSKAEYYPKAVAQKPAYVRNNKNIESDGEQMIDITFLADVKKGANIDNEIIEYWDDDRAEESIEEKRKEPHSEKKIVKKVEKKEAKKEMKKEIKIETKSPLKASPPKRPMFINLEGHPKEYLAATVNIEIIPDQECPICYDSFVMHQITSRLECFCLYHQDCIELWWAKKEQRTCPFHVFEKYEETKKT